MRARVSVWTIEGDHLESVISPRSRLVGQWIRVMAGLEGSIGEESFDLLVCTPDWLKDEVSRTGAIVGRHHLIVDSWDAARVRQTVTTLFTGEQADDWEHLGEKLARLGHWEFEDYVAF